MTARALALVVLLAPSAATAEETAIAVLGPGVGDFHAPHPLNPF